MYFQKSSIGQATAHITVLVGSVSVSIPAGDNNVQGRERIEKCSISAGMYDIRYLSGCDLQNKNFHLDHLTQNKKQNQVINYNYCPLCPYNISR